MNSVEVEKLASKIKRALFKNANSFAQGMFRSHFRGAGLQFKEHRLYEHGDDVRFIDWKVSAKTKEAYLKTFEEERNVEIVVFIDTSLSMFGGHNGLSKLEAAVTLTSLIHLLAKSSGDMVHVILMGEKFIEIPPSKGDEGIIRLLSCLDKMGLVAGGQIISPVTFPPPVTEKQFAAEVMKHMTYKREIVIFSDFHELPLVDTLKKIMSSARLHCFELKTPLDDATSTPFIIHGLNALGKSLGLRRIRVKDRKEKSREREFKGRLKTLNLSDRYLENFVKEMI